MKKNKLKKYWTHAEVEEYTKKLLSSAELSLAEQKERITELKNQNNKLTKDNQELKSREKLLSSALTEATRKAKDIELTTQAKANLEIEKVKQFSAKWTNLFDELAKIHPELSGKSIKHQFRAEVEELIDQIFEANNMRLNWEDRRLAKKPRLEDVTTNSLFEYETNRPSTQTPVLSQENEERFNKLISKIKSGMIFATELQEPNESGFNIDEALNPKESLDKIIGDLLED